MIACDLHSDWCSSPHAIHVSVEFIAEGVQQYLMGLDCHQHVIIG